MRFSQRAQTLVVRPWRSVKMRSRLILFIGVLFAGIALEQKYCSQFLVGFSSVDTFAQVVRLQLIGSFLWIAGVLVWAFITLEKRKKKKFKPLASRKMETSIIIAFVVGLALLRNMEHASGWTELLKGTALHELSLLIFAFPMLAFHLCFYPYLTGLKRTEQVSGHNSGKRSALTSA